jgi:hypothetical protein
MPEAASPQPGGHQPPRAAILIVPFVVALALTLFAWPASRLEPRDLPVGVAGPADATGALEQRLGTKEGAFEIHRYGDEAAAREAIQDRDIYGAFVASRIGPVVLTSTGASANVAGLLEQAATEAEARGGPRARVIDVAPGSKEDPRGTGLASSVLPLVLAGVLVGLVTVFVAPTLVRRVYGLIIGSVLSGLAAIVIAQWWLGVIEHNWLANWAVLSLLVLAISTFVAGCQALLGTPGIALGALTMVLIGNPFSAVSSAPELLPKPVGLIGQLMPPGAGGNALRSTAFFDGTDAAGHIVVMAVWVLVGAAALTAAVTTKRSAQSHAEPASSPPASGANVEVAS